MKNNELLEMAKAQILHLEGARKSLAPNIEYVQLASSTGVIKLIDMAMEDNREQELTTRLYNLVNDAKTVLLDLGTHVATDDVNSNGLLLSLTQAEETLKKVIQ